jgi:hypothetical protein
MPTINNIETSDLAKISRLENSSLFKIVASVWQAYKMILLLVQKQSYFYITWTTTFI